MLDREDAPAEEEAGVPEDATPEEDLWSSFDDTPAEEEDPDAGEDLDEGEPEEADPGEDGDEPAETQTYEQLKEQFEKLEQKFRSEQNRARGQQRRADTLAKELEELRNREAASPGDSEEVRRERAEKIEAAKSEYGDVVGPLVEVIDDLQKRVDDLSAGEKQELRSKEAELAQIVEEQTAGFLDHHPDGFDVLRQHGSTFRAWIEDQPKMYRDIYERNRRSIVDGEGAAVLVSRFKMALAEADMDGSPPEPQTQPQSRKRQRQLDGARATRGRSRQAAVTEIPADSEDPDQIWDYWDRKDRRR